MERRSVIVSLFSGIFAGCSTLPEASRDGSTTGSPVTPSTSETSSSGTTTVTETPPSAPSLTELSFSATVVRQLSSSTPPRLRVVLTNEGETEVAVGPGQQLMFSSDFGTPVADPLIFYPASNGPETQVDGCWMAGPDDQFTPQSIVRWTTLQSGDEIRSTIDVYTLESADECFPDGEYVFSSGIYWQSEERSVRLTVDVAIQKEKLTSVTARMSDV